MREYLGVRKQLGSPCMSGVRVGVHDATRRRSPHSAKQGHHSLSLREIELCIDHEPSAGVDEPGARMPRRCPVGDAGIDVVADFLELHASVNGRSGTLFGTSLACHPWPIYRDCAFIKSVSPSKRRNASQRLSPRKHFTGASGTSAISRKRTKSVSVNCPPTPSRVHRSRGGKRVKRQCLRHSLWIRRSSGSRPPSRLSGTLSSATTAD